MIKQFYFLFNLFIFTALAYQTYVSTIKNKPKSKQIEEISRMGAIREFLKN